MTADVIALCKENAMLIGASNQTRSALYDYSGAPLKNQCNNEPGDKKWRVYDDDGGGVYRFMCL